MDSKEFFACSVIPKMGDFQHPGVLYFAMEIVSGNLP